MLSTVGTRVARSIDKLSTICFSTRHGRLLSTIFHIWAGQVKLTTHEIENQTIGYLL